MIWKTIFEENEVNNAEEKASKENDWEQVSFIDFRFR
jgi:hypothetical protein